MPDNTKSQLRGLDLRRLFSLQQSLQNLVRSPMAQAIVQLQASQRAFETPATHIFKELGILRSLGAGTIQPTAALVARQLLTQYNLLECIVSNPPGASLNRAIQQLSSYDQIALPALVSISSAISEGELDLVGN